MPLMIAITLSISIDFYFPFTLIPSQVNAVIYFTRSSRIRRYYYKLLNARIKRKDLTKPSVRGFNSNRRCQLTAAAEFYIKAKAGNRNFYCWCQTICKCSSTETGDSFLNTIISTYLNSMFPRKSIYPKKIYFCMKALTYMYGIVLNTPLNMSTKNSSFNFIESVSLRLILSEATQWGFGE